MIKTFQNKETAALFQGLRIRRPDTAIQRKALIKLKQLDAAATRNDLSIPPSNRLESLHGDRKGQYSIRVNQQWRICFKWENCNAYDVEFCDYH